MVLEGSSTGKPFAADGTPSWPRNVALVFAQYEEFSTLMWGVDLARDVTQSPKLWALFGTQGPVEPGKVYGDIAQGTARVLYTPAITHPAEHISHEAIGYSLDWFAKTLQGGTPRPVDDQIWFRKEIGTLIALIGFVALLIGAFDALLEAPMYSRLRLPEIADGTMPEHTAASGRRWTTAFILSAFIPALTYYPAFALGGTFVTPSAFLPQGITNQILVWAVINGLITLALMRFAPKRASRSGIVLQSVVIAIASVAIGYAALWLADLAFKIDFRFWIVALKLMSAKQFLIFLIYLVPFTAFFVIALHVLHRNFSTMAAPRGALYLTNILALTLGFIVLRGRAIRHPLAHRKAVQPAARPRLRAAVDHRRHPVRAAAGDLRRDRDLYLAADRLQPARRADLRPVRDLVRGGGDGDPGGVLTLRRSYLKDGLKLHNGLASAGRSAVL